MSRRQNQRAFTLIELLLVLVILVVLATLVLPKLTGRSKQAKIDAAKSQISLFDNALSLYESDVGNYPTSQQGLLALVEAPSGVKGWKGPYLTKTSIPNDPWGNAYIYVCPGQHKPDMYDLSSNGPEGNTEPIDNWTTQ
ncbi:MAG TPA: type II secretion system major pseudopilin GspG [Phycisphaerae bacterium]|nr:type II secretion system major pseudopilin GspG [Phycisphaerae bacterium]